MAMNKTALENEIVSNLEEAGFNTSGEHSKSRVMARAVADAVVDHIQANAKAMVSSGSSAGSHPIE